MAIDVTMPQMGESVVEGTIAKWLVKEGDVVTEDQPLVEISTDKVDTEIPSPGAGRIAKIVAAEGRDDSGWRDDRSDRAGRRRGYGKTESGRAESRAEAGACARSRRSTARKAGAEDCTARRNPRRRPSRCKRRARGCVKPSLILAVRGAFRPWC